MKKSRKFWLPFAAALTMALGMLVPAGASASVHDPLLFVHGWTGSAGQFDSLKSRFSAAGWTSNEMATVSYGVLTSNTTVANKIKSAVTTLLSKNPGKTQVTLVSHSMGGISTRYYVKNLGGLTKVKTFVSLAGANHGTYTAIACAWFDPGCYQMVPGSSYLNALNSGDETPGSLNWATWWSSADGTINPPSSTVLSGAQNTEVAGISHTGILTDTGVGNAVVSYVTAN